MGATSRLLMLLSTPFPRPSSPLRVALRHFSALPSLPTLKPLCRLLLLPSLRASHHFHSHPAVHIHDASRAWPEWSRFLEHVTSGGYAHSGDGGDGVDAFNESLEVQDEFARGVRACLSFARNRPTLLKLLPEKDIRVVVENSSPFLFKNCSETVQRMSFFLNPVGGSVDKVQTADLVRYLTSYAYSQLFCSREIGANATGFVEASVCNLLNEMVNLSGPVQKSYFRESNNRKNLSTFEQSPRSKSNIEKKRGDWICPKCSFLNFARNMNCLECNELRPKRQLTGGEWECPKCYFYNYGRNMACLKCDCECPGNSFSPGAASEASSENTIFSSGQAVGANNSITRSLDRILGKTSNVSVADNNGSQQVYVGRRGEITPSEGRNSDYVPFVPLPADMFKAPNVSNLEDQPYSPSVVSQTEVPADIGYHEAFDPYKRTSAVSDVGMSATSISYDFPDIMPMRKGENRFVVSKKKDRSLTSPQYKRRLAMDQANDSNFVPFVPFPPGYFARKDNLLETGSPAVKADPLSTDTAFSANPQNGPERSDEIRSSNWMPSENPQSSQQNGNTESSIRNWYRDKMDPPRNSGEYAPSSDYSDSQKNAAQQNWESRFSQGAAPSRMDVSWNSKQPSYYNHKQNQGNDQSSNFSENSLGSHYRRMDLSPSNRTNRSLGDRKIDGQNSGYSSRGDNNETDRGVSSASQSVTNLGTGENSGWKSLEGSAVTEPDPLDMSEEAKAQRWFRRVAQITDISELANIPDEDFPQIMPMRKGVNRFVVSKRKTPLERRLTSPQYRRNLPIVSSEPENDSSNQRKT